MGELSERWEGETAISFPSDMGVSNPLPHPITSPAMPCGSALEYLPFIKLVITKH